jgi:hypothetical protein
MLAAHIAAVQGLQRRGTGPAEHRSACRQRRQQRPQCSQCTSTRCIWPYCPIFDPPPPDVHVKCFVFSKRVDGRPPNRAAAKAAACAADRSINRSSRQPERTGKPTSSHNRLTQLRESMGHAEQSTRVAHRDAECALTGTLQLRRGTGSCGLASSQPEISVHGGGVQTKLEASMSGSRK